ncbi:MAG: TonB-dependent receptor family protein [Methylohalobius sp.]
MQSKSLGKFRLRPISASLLMMLAMPPYVLAAEEPPKQKTDGGIELPVIEVIGGVDKLQTLSGSGQILEQETLYKSHVFTPHEALRKVPGLHIRDEEGFGLRPNIGIRGMNPTRSTKTLLLEDGLPLSYAPYGDNASYYHPPIERFDSVELIKGAEQIKFGPQTISGTINYITPTPPLEPGGFILFTGGNRDYLNGHLRGGGTFGKFGGLVDYIRKQGDGARDNTNTVFDDVNLKALIELTPNSSLIWRGNYFREDSEVTYTGITDAERRNFGLRYNPFKNDHFTIDRWGTSVTHQYRFNDDVELTTSFYWAHFSRDWWRQSSTTTDPQCEASSPGFRNKRLQGVAVDVDACKSAQGRLRDYYTWGIEPRLRVAHNLFGVPSVLDVGFRAHYEEQFRRQKNVTSPTARQGVLAEDNERFAEAYAGFVQNRFILGDWTFTPGVRVESMVFERKNRLPGGVQGQTDLIEPIPSFAMTYSPLEETTLFFGFHRGFAPPRVEDSISGKGTSIDIEAERSWNYELGVRSRPWKGVRTDLTLFRNDFENLIAVGSIAGGSTPIAQGKAIFQGIELFARADAAEVFNWTHNPYVQIAYTWLAEADMVKPFRCLPVDGVNPCAATGGVVPGSKAGNRSPYAPEHLITATVGYSHPMGFDVHLETVFVADQFSDFANLKKGADHPDGPTSPAALSGQFGKIDDYTIVNLAGTYRVTKGLDLFVAVKNLFDNDYIVDRTRGILPGAPRLVQAGLRYEF